MKPVRTLQNIDLRDVYNSGKGLHHSDIVSDIINNHDPMDMVSNIEWFFESYPNVGIEKYFNVISKLDYLLNANSVFLQYKLVSINIVKNSNQFVVVEYKYVKE